MLDAAQYAADQRDQRPSWADRLTWDHACIHIAEGIARATVPSHGVLYSAHSQGFKVVPRPPFGSSLYAVNCATGEWRYVNHASEWHLMPNPLRCSWCNGHREPGELCACNTRSTEAA